MNVTCQELEGLTVATVSESLEIDVGNAEEFKGAILEAIGDAKIVILDATLVEFFDSAGMAALLSIKKRLAALQGSFYIAGLNQAVQEIFRMVGFDVVFKVFPDVPQAVTAIRES